MRGETDIVIVSGQMQAGYVRSEETHWEKTLETKSGPDLPHLVRFPDPLHKRVGEPD